MTTKRFGRQQEKNKISKGSSPEVSTIEKITLEKNNPYAWICLCRNESDGEGFLPCDETGNEVEPFINGPWKGMLYVCVNCKRIINQYTLEVIGQNPKAKMLAC